MSHLIFKIPYSAPSALLGPLDIVPGLPAPEARLQPGGRVVHHPGVQLAQVCVESGIETN